MRLMQLHKVKPSAISKSQSRSQSGIIIQNCTLRHGIDCIMNDYTTSYMYISLLCNNNPQF